MVSSLAVIVAAERTRCRLCKGFASVGKAHRCSALSSYAYSLGAVPPFDDPAGWAQDQVLDKLRYSHGLWVSFFKCPSTQRIVRHHLIIYDTADKGAGMATLTGLDPFDPFVLPASSSFSSGSKNMGSSSSSGSSGGKEAQAAVPECKLAVGMYLGKMMTLKELNKLQAEQGKEHRLESVLVRATGKHVCPIAADIMVRANCAHGTAATALVQEIKGRVYMMAAKVAPLLADIEWDYM